MIRFSSVFSTLQSFYPFAEYRPYRQIKIESLSMYMLVESYLER